MNGLNGFDWDDQKVLLILIVILFACIMFYTFNDVIRENNLRVKGFDFEVT